jgi:ERF superfamily
MIYGKLLKAKKEIGKVKKTMRNSHFKNTYADINNLLEVVEPVLLENCLLLLQPVINNKVITQIIDAETGEKIESILELDGNLNPQQRGSQITYYRRYTLQSLLSLEVIDDDGNNASQNIKPKKVLISEQQFNKAVERIINGEVELYAKLKETYELSSQQIIELEEIIKA